jgi:hypothetical protein
MPERVSSAEQARRTFLMQQQIKAYNMRRRALWPTPSIVKPFQLDKIRAQGLTPWPDFQPGDVGYHWSGSCYPEHNNWEWHLGKLQEMGVRVVKFLSDGNGAGPGGGCSGVQFAKWLTDHGMIGVVRFYMDAAHRLTDANLYAMEAFIRVGCVIFEFYNEPDLALEWPGGTQPKDWAERSWKGQLPLMLACLKLGGHPLTPSLASGFLQMRDPNLAGQLTINPFFWYQEAGLPDGDFGVAIHDYQLNHPTGDGTPQNPGYPDDDVNRHGTPLTQAEFDHYGGREGFHGASLEQVNGWRATDKNPAGDIHTDDSCYRSGEIFKELAEAAGFHHLKYIGTEGGWWGCYDDQQDRRYPSARWDWLREQAGPALQYQIRNADWLKATNPWLYAQESLGAGYGWRTCQLLWPGGPGVDGDGFIPARAWLINWKQNPPPPPPPPPVTDVPDITADLPRSATEQYATRALTDITTIVLHHTVTPDTTTPAQIAAYHVNTRGYPGIAYHYLIDATGQAWQTNALTSVSYHCGAHNPESIGIALIGDFTAHVPTAAQLAKTVEIVAQLCEALGLPSSAAVGHKDLPGAATQCPGNQWDGGAQYRDTFLAALAAKLNEILPPGGDDVDYPPLPVENDAAAYGVSIMPCSPQPGEWYWQVVKVHHLSQSENNGNHNLFVDVLDEAGRRINGARVQLLYPDGRTELIVIDKPVNEPGGNAPLWKQDVVSAHVLGEPVKSDLVAGVSPAHADEPPGNTLYHHSFLVVWRKVQAATVVVEPPDEPPDTEDENAFTAQDYDELMVIRDGLAVVRSQAETLEAQLNTVLKRHHPAP